MIYRKQTKLLTLFENLYSKPCSYKHESRTYNVMLTYIFSWKNHPRYFSLTRWDIGLAEYDISKINDEIYSVFEDPLAWVMLIAITDTNGDAQYQPRPNIRGIWYDNINVQWASPKFPQGVSTHADHQYQSDFASKPSLLVLSPFLFGNKEIYGKKFLLSTFSKVRSIVQRHDSRFCRMPHPSTQMCSCLYRI